MKGYNMASSKSAIAYRRNRKLQGGGDKKMQYVTGILNSHKRPLPDGIRQTSKPVDVPYDYVEHPVN